MEENKINYESMSTNQLEKELRRLSNRKSTLINITETFSGVQMPRIEKHILECENKIKEINKVLNNRK
jgi:hypothetical protein